MENTSEELIRVTLGKVGMTFEELAAKLDTLDRRALSWRLQNMRRAGLLARRGDRWINREAASRSGPSSHRGKENGKAQLTVQKVRKIRALAEHGMSWVAIASVVGTTPENCQMIAQRKRWAWVS